MPNLLRTASNVLARQAAAHKARHTPTGLGFALADRINYLDPAAWDHVTRGASVMLSRRYLRVLESTGPTNLSGRYAMIYHEHQPIACVAAQSVLVSGDRLGAATKPARDDAAKERHRDRLKRLATSRLAHLEQRLLVCGNLLSWGNHGIAIAPDASHPDVWAGVAEALYRIRRADKLLGESDLLMVKDITPNEATNAQELKTYSYRRLETDPNMVLDLDPKWKTFDDYLANLNSKYRSEAKRIAKDVETAGLRTETSPISPAEAQTLHDLYMQVHANARIRLFTLCPEFMPALAAEFKDDFRCTRLRRESDSRTLGFVTTLRDGETAIGYYIGFDRATNADAPLYFRLLQACVADAITMGCKRLSLGRTALEPKARLGAKPVPMEVWIRHRVPAMNLLVRAALRGVHHDEAPERKTFK